MEEKRKKRYKCGLCHQFFKRKDSLIRHQNASCLQHQLEKDNSEKPTFKCIWCNGVFKRKDSLTRHQKVSCPQQRKPDEDSSGEPTYKCSWCNGGFKRKDALTKHQKKCPRYLDYLEEAIKCKTDALRQTNSNFSNMSLLITPCKPEKGAEKEVLFTDQIEILDDQKAEIICEHCFKKFDTQQNLQRHQMASCPFLQPAINEPKNTNVKKRAHKCDHCNQMFSRKDGLTRHLKLNRCSGNFKNLAEYLKCNIKSKRRRYLKTLLKENSVRPHHCEKDSEDKNISKPAFKCIRCNTTFTTRTHLTRHQKGDACNRALVRLQHLKYSADVSGHLSMNGTCKPKRQFKCDPCGEYFKKADHLLQHFKKPQCKLYKPPRDGDKPKVAKFICQKCKKRFTSKQSLNYHTNWNACPGNQKVGHFKSFNYLSLESIQCEDTRRKATKQCFHKCDTCGNFYTARKALLHHQRAGCQLDKVLEFMKENNINRIFLCKKCDKAFISERHLLFHTNENKCRSKRRKKSEELSAIVNCQQLPRFMCDSCGATFKERKGLNRHVRKNCLRVLDKLNRELLWIRMTTAEERIDLKCIPCCKTFKLKRQLQLHKRCYCLKTRNQDEEEIRQVHQSSILCESCGLLYTSKQNYLQHTKNGNCTEAKHICSHCNSTFTRSQSLRVHEKHRCQFRLTKKLPLPFKCNLCDQSFAKLGILEYHIYHQICKHNKTIIGTAKNFWCKRCHQRFAVKHSVRIHGRRRICQRFQAVSDISEDVVIEMLEMQFPCRWCYSYFSSQSEMLNHMHTVHKKDITLENVKPVIDENQMIVTTSPKTICCYICLKQFKCVYSSLACIRKCELQAGLSIDGYVHPRLR